MSDLTPKIFDPFFIQCLQKIASSGLLGHDGQETIEAAVEYLQDACNASGDAPVFLDVQASDAPEEIELVEEPDHCDLSIEAFEIFQSIFMENRTHLLILADLLKNEGNRLTTETENINSLLAYNTDMDFEPDDPEWYCNRAASNIRAADYHSAVLDCKSAIECNETYARAHCLLGIAYMNMEMHQEAQECFAAFIGVTSPN